MNLQEFKLNRPQLNKVLNPAALGVDIWGRGTGKSFIIAWLIKEAITKMPRGTFLIYGSTYIDILTNTLPTTLEGLSRLGYVKDLHYTVGKRPPKRWKWPEPFQPILDAERIIYFCNGTVFQLASQDRTKRGANVDGILCDEGLLIKKDKFEKDVLPTNRGNVDRFGHLKIHHFVHIFSSMPWTPEGNWLIETGNYYKDELGLNYRATKTALVKKELAFVDSHDYEEKRQLWADIAALKKQLKYFSYKDNDGTIRFYQEADCFDNIKNLGFKSILKQRKLMTDLSFRIEMLNEYVTALEGGFYPNLDFNKHTYDDSINYDWIDSMGFDFKKLENRDSRWDADCDTNRRLEIAVDWGAHINCMVVHQTWGTVEKTIKALYVKPPKILDHLFEEFCHYYRHHQTKVVDFYYDRNGNSKIANSDLTFSEQGARIMRKNGWSVNMKTRGLDPAHKDKYYLINLILSGERTDLPTWQCNYTNAKEVINSMLNAPAKDVNGEFKKDKSSERNPSIKQEEATHFSDAEDIMLYSKYKHVIEGNHDILSLLTSR